MMTPTNGWIGVESLTAGTKTDAHQNCNAEGGACRFNRPRRPFGQFDRPFPTSTFTSYAPKTLSFASRSITTPAIKTGQSPPNFSTSLINVTRRPFGFASATVAGRTDTVSDS
jgi:hypothetical protein